MKTKMTLTILSVLLFGLLFCSGSRAGENQWKVGLARIKVTPSKPVWLAGYASRTKPFAKVASDLYVKVLVLDDHKGQRLVLVTSDLIGFPAHVTEPICQRLQKTLGLKREQILINASHTHTGPLVSLHANRYDNLSPGDAQRTIAYTRTLQDKVVTAVERAVKKLQPARLAWGTGIAHFVMNRREFTPRGVRLGVNPRGLADRSVPVLRIRNEAGKMIAVVYGCATHNTTLGGNFYDVCGDYAGFSQAYLEKQFPGTQAMFLIGCAGDSNPYPRGTLAISRQHGQTLGAEVTRILKTKLTPIKGPLKITFTRVQLPLKPAPPRRELETKAKGRGVNAWVAQQMLKVLKKGEKLPTHYPYTLTVLQFGKDLTLVGMAGEVVVDYVRLLEEKLGPNKLWIAAYCNDVFGYLPSKRTLREGGYETRGIYVGGIGYFTPRVEGVVVTAVRRLAAQAGRVIPKN